MNIVELPNARDAGTPPPFIVFCRAAGFFITEMERSGKDGFRFLVIWCFGSLVAGSVIAVRRLVEKKVMGFGLRRRQVAGSRVGGRDDRSVRFASLNGTLRGASEREPGSSRGSGYRRRRFRNDGRAAGPGRGPGPWAANARAWWRDGQSLIFSGSARRSWMRKMTRMSSPAMRRIVEPMTMTAMPAQTMASSVP